MSSYLAHAPTQHISLAYQTINLFNPLVNYCIMFVNGTVHGNAEGHHLTLVSHFTNMTATPLWEVVSYHVAMNL